MAKSKEEKKVYFAGLRKSWEHAKKALTAGKISEIDAIMLNHGMNVSQTGFMVIMLQMQDQGLDGVPYLDAKTYKGWKDNGFHVKKGQKSTLSGVTWISAGEDGDGKASFVFPKEYKLFHRSQVAAAGVNATPMFAECA